MKYEDIEALVKRYGNDYLAQNAIEQIFNIAKDSQSMREQLENGITEEWLDLLKSRGVIYVYTDPRKPSIQDKENRYPCMEFTFQDERDISNPQAKTKRTPVLRYAYQVQKTIMGQPTSLDDEFKHRIELERTKKRIEESDGQR